MFPRNETGLLNRSKACNQCMTYVVALFSPFRHVFANHDPQVPPYTIFIWTGVVVPA
jgi:hypothetical protein